MIVWRDKGVAPETFHGKPIEWAVDPDCVKAHLRLMESKANAIGLAILTLQGRSMHANAMGQGDREAALAAHIVLGERVYGGYSLKAVLHCLRSVFKQEEDADDFCWRIGWGGIIAPDPSMLILEPQVLVRVTRPAPPLQPSTREVSRKGKGTHGH